MSLDVANKTNIDLQKVIKKQSLQLTELQAHYDDVQRQLQQTLDQLGVAQRRLQAITGELEEVRLNYDNCQRAKRAVELQYEEATTRISELSVLNANIAASRAKIEQELAIVAGDYEEITKELRLSDERYQKVQVWADTFEPNSLFSHVFNYSSHITGRAQEHHWMSSWGTRTHH